MARECVLNARDISLEHVRRQSHVGVVGTRQSRCRTIEEPLKAALMKAQEQSRVRPSAERLDSCLPFIERAKGRVSPAEARIRESQDDKFLVEAQLVQAQQDLVRMREEGRSTARASSAVRTERGNSASEGSGFETRGREFSAKAIARVVSSFSRPRCHGYRRHRGSVPGLRL